MQLWHYNYSGLSITSELSLPEWAAFETHNAATPDVRFSVMTPTPIFSTANEDWLFLGERHCHFQVPEIGYYSVNEGNSIAVTPMLGAGMREIRLFLIASAWAALCYQRSLLPLHASVIQVGDGAVAFCGDSGAGKSSTAAWFLERDYPLVSDDLCICHFSKDKIPHVWPSATRLKLWNETLDVLGWDRAGSERDYFRFEKFHLTCPKGKHSLPASLPLRAIYLLEWGELSLDRFRGSRALQAVVENATYRGDLIEPTENVAAHWTRCAQLVSQLPVWRLTRPRDWNQMNSVSQMLIKHWQ